MALDGNTALSEENASETTPLLNEVSHQHENGTSGSTSSSFTSKQRGAIVVLGILMLMIDFGTFLGTPPQIKIFEDIICRNYYRNQTRLGTTILPFDDEICKAEPVQSELALVTGLKNTFDVLPGILLGLPYGVLADHIGRKPILFLAVLGALFGEIWARIVCWFDMPLRLVWLCGLWQIIGGGSPVATSMILVIVADLCSEEQRATALFYISATATMAEIVASPISALMMSTNAWLPYLVGLGITVLTSAFVPLMPETIQEARERTRKLSNAEHQVTADNADFSARTPITAIYSKVQEFFRSIQFIWRNLSILFILSMVFVSNLSKESTGLLLQYVSAKYHRSIAQASFLISLRGSVQIVTTLLLVPLVSSFLLRYAHLGAVRKDLSIAQVSAGLTMVGFLLIFLAERLPLLVVGVILVSLGSPFAICVLSVATSFVPADHAATLYSAFSITRSIGMVVAGPVFAGIYGFGMRLGLSWSGLPFGVASLIFLGVFISVCCVRTTERP